MKLRFMIILFGIFFYPFYEQLSNIYEEHTMNLSGMEYGDSLSLLLKQIEKYMSEMEPNNINDENSIFNHYKKLIKLRKDYKVISEGKTIPILKDDQNVLNCVTFRRHAWTPAPEGRRETQEDVRNCRCSGRHAR